MGEEQHVVNYGWAGNCTVCGGNLQESKVCRTISCDCCGYEINYETGVVTNDGKESDERA